MSARHRWSEADHWSTPRECLKCGMRKERFGTASSRYDLFFKDGEMVANTGSGDKTPPCDPNAPIAPNPQFKQVVGWRSEGDPRPSRSMRCAHCGKALEWLPGGAWTVARGPGLTGRTPECPVRPNDDGFGAHEPGTPIVHPPVDASASELAR